MRSKGGGWPVSITEMVLTQLPPPLPRVADRRFIGQLRKCPQGKKGGKGEEEFDV